MQSDSNSGVYSTLIQRHLSRSPVLARQESASCKFLTIAPSHAATDAATHEHSARNVLATIFERSAILSNNRSTLTPVHQGSSRRRGGSFSAHQRAAKSVDVHAFESFSAQALACEGPSHNPCSDLSIAASVPARMPFPHGTETLAPADQVHSTAACKTPGWVPGAPLREQPGNVFINRATCHLPGWVPGAPLGEQPGNLDGALDLPSSAHPCSPSLAASAANIHRRQRSARNVPWVILAMLVVHQLVPASSCRYLAMQIHALVRLLICRCLLPACALLHHTLLQRRLSMTLI